MLKKRPFEFGIYFPILRARKIRGAEFSGAFKTSDLSYFMSTWRRIFPSGLEPLLTKIIDRVMICVRSLVWINGLPCPPLSNFQITLKQSFARSRYCTTIYCKLAGRNVWTYCGMENRCQYFGNITKQLFRYQEGVYLQIRKHSTPGSRC